MTKFEGIKNAFEAAKIGKDMDRQITSNTRVSVYGSKINVRLHDTNVFTYDTNTGAIVLRFGGWFTVTTRQTINTALQACGLNYAVSFRKGNVYINNTLIQVNDGCNYRLLAA